MRRQKKQVVTDTWLNTYSDMVTLLLSFFVMLFAMSTMDSAKWEMLVESVSSNVQVTQPAQAQHTGSNTASSTGQPLTDVKEFDDLYLKLKDYVNEKNLNSQISVTKGKDFTFIVFRNNIFFDGDSYLIKTEGKAILDTLCNGIQGVSKQIGEIRILGHTSQADPNKRNSTEVDRFLSSNRATKVLVYIQDKNIIEPSKLVSIGYGQNYPIASFATAEGRAQNRRVEILITKSKAVNMTLDEVYQSVSNNNTKKTN